MLSCLAGTRPPSPTTAPLCGGRLCSVETLRQGGRSSGGLNLLSSNSSGLRSPWSPSKNPYTCPMRAQCLDPAVWRRNQQLIGVGWRSSKHHREKSTDRSLLPPHPIVQEGTLLFPFSSSPPNSRGGRKESGRWGLSLCDPTSLTIAWPEREEEKSFASHMRSKL